jgi:hypothetical protein
MPILKNAHALVVGIANYLHVNRLPGTVLKDAHDIHDLLVDPRYCGYPSGSVQLLLDAEATRVTLLQSLDRLARDSDPDSTVFLYVSSHGGRVESGPYAGEYLLPVDVDYTSAQALAETAISGDALTAALGAIAARKVVVVFDCCHAAGIGRPKDVTAPVLEAGLPEAYYEALTAGRGRAILASSRSTEYSYAVPGAENSVFTQHLLAGMHGGIPSDDGLIRIFDLFEYVQPHVTADQPGQHPVFKAEVEENFPIALYLGGQKGSVPRDEEGFRYDAYVSYAVDSDADDAWVWDVLLPRLRAEGLQVAVSGDTGDPGVARVANIERGITQARRTVLVLSPAYLEDRLADFENTLAQTLSIEEDAARLIPVTIAPFEQGRLPARIRMLDLRLRDLTRPRSAERGYFERLVQDLKSPLGTFRYRRDRGG